MSGTIRAPLFGGITLLCLAVPAWVSAAEEEAAEELEAVVVTGSRIPTVQAAGPSPVTVITAADIAARGFTTITEVANSLTQVTGTAQNETQAGTFTQNAGALELRGLGPGRTLILVDGRRVADYPLPYNGESNFVNLSAIPAAAVERVELLSSGASAVYGSDAVAGVLNIVLRKRAQDPLTVELRHGDTTQGGGESTRLQLVTGGTLGGFDVLLAGELFDRKPIYAFQRDFQDSVLDNPNPAGRIFPRALLRTDPFDMNGDDLTYIDPGAAACDPFSQSMEHAFRPGSGYYCGQDDAVSQYTLRNERQRASLLARASYALDNARLYASANVYGARDRLDLDFASFSTDFMVPGDTGYFFDVSEDPDGLGGNVALMQRYLQPWEIGGYGARQERVHEDLVDYTLGVAGGIGASRWNYDLAVSGSHYNLKDYRPFLLIEPVRDYFIGTQLTDDDGNPVYQDVLGFDFPVYSARWDRFYAPVTPQLWQQFTNLDRQVATSSSRSLSLQLDGHLADLPHGPLAAALVVEAARQQYNIDLTDEMEGGAYIGIVGTGGGGRRDRHAVGGELRVPIVPLLQLQLAGRYDHYDDITQVDGAFTYNLGLEFRPLPQLLVRGSYATSFRAPDMHYVFAEPSGFFTTVTDEYLCRRDEPGVPLSECASLSGGSVEGARQGNPFLVEEEGKSWTLGFVAQPVSGLTVSADYYRIRLEGGVQDDSLGLLLQTEADCRLGQTMAGTPVDTGSVKCQSALARVQRRPADGGPESEFLDRVTQGPINTALMKTSGFDAALRYAFRPAGAWGRFEVASSFTQVLQNERLEFAGDEIEDLLENRARPDWHSRLSGELSWTRGPLAATLFVQRHGHIWNWAETEQLRPYVLTNLSARYNGLMRGQAYVGFAVQNLFDRNPPRDDTWDVYPYYSSYNYSPIGREVFVELGLRL